MRELSTPPNYVIIELIESNKIKFGSLELEIVDKYNPEDWEKNYGILRVIPPFLTGEIIPDKGWDDGYNGKEVPYNFFQKSYEKLVVNQRVYFHASDVIPRNDDSQYDGNIFDFEGKRYLRLPIYLLYAIEGEKDEKGIPKITKLNDYAFVEPIANNEVISPGGIYYPDSFKAKHQLYKGLMDGYVVYMSNFRQMRLHKIGDKEYYIFHKGRIAAIENEKGEIEPTNYCVFVKPKKFDKVSEWLYLPEAFKKELQSEARKTDYWLGTITSASPQSIPRLRADGMSRVVGTECYIGSGFDFELEIDGEMVWIINTYRLGDSSIVAWVTN